MRGTPNAVAWLVGGYGYGSGVTLHVSLAYVAARQAMLSLRVAALLVFMCVWRCGSPGVITPETGVRYLARAHL